MRRRMGDEQEEEREQEQEKQHENEEMLEEDQEEGESSGDATEEASNKEGPQQRFLYFYEAGQQWYFNSENTPDKDVCWAREQTEAAGLRPLPMGAGMAWSVFTGEEMKDMSLTLEPADRSS